jgi:DNA (cytosine-5)-methyltransferase 1
VCSGIEAVSLAWRPLGWRPAWFSEIDPFACAVLAHHYSIYIDAMAKNILL